MADYDKEKLDKYLKIVLSNSKIQRLDLSEKEIVEIVKECYIEINNL